MRNKKKIPKVPLILGIILLMTIIFCFLIFETDVVYDVDITSFNTVGNQLKLPISVQEIILRTEVENDSDSGSTPGIQPPGTTPPQAPSTPVDTDGSGKLVKSVYSIGLYDGPTQNGSGVFVNVRPSYDEYGASYKSWWVTCYNNTSSPGNTLRGRADGTTVADGVMVDSSSRPLVAVGPAVMNHSRTYGSMQTPTASEMRYGSIIDVVLEDGSNTYYMPAVVVDCKAHTYPTWIVQSGYAVKNNQLYYTAPGHKDNYTTPSSYDKSLANAYIHACVEFTASDNNLSALSGYSVKGIIVY